MATQSQFDIKVLVPAAGRTTSATGAAVDLQNYINPGGRQMKALLDVGVITTAGTLDVKIQHSDTTTAGDFADISGATFTQVTASTGAEAIHFRTNKRYIRALATFGASTNGYSFGVYALAELREK